MVHAGQVVHALRGFAERVDELGDGILGCVARHAEDDRARIEEQFHEHEHQTAARESGGTLDEGQPPRSKGRSSLRLSSLRSPEKSSPASFPARSGARVAPGNWSRPDNHLEGARPPSVSEEFA